MDLDDLTMLAAASLLAGTVKADAIDKDRIYHPSDLAITEAVTTAKLLWKEVRRRAKE